LAKKFLNKKGVASTLVSTDSFALLTYNNKCGLRSKVDRLLGEGLCWITRNGKFTLDGISKPENGHI
jgi:hypothetical protein